MNLEDAHDNENILYRIERLHKEIAEYISKYRFEGGSSEFDSEINDLSRDLILAYNKKYGKVWLGKINRYNEDKNKPYLKEYDGGMIYNFEYTFLIPEYDKEIIEMIKEREDAGFEGVKEDIQRIDKIIDRINEIDGCLLHWS